MSLQEARFRFRYVQTLGYAFFFSQKGVMAGLGLEGTKITETHPEP